ncbi:MAG TPA: WbqC family protein [Flavitalea sp.]|nr:WbqC family protein [Flavitalea sp.]
MIPILVEYQYFPSLTYLAALSHSTHIIFYTYDQFRKMSFRNRCVIAGANGPLLLTVPLKGGRDQKSFSKEIEIDNRIRWQSSHWKSICSAYNHSPWFDQYRDSLQPIFENQYQLLNDLSLDVFEWILNQLGWHFTHTSGDVPDREFIDLRNTFTPKNTRVNPIPYVYRQVFQERIGFLPNLSVIDLIFCIGPRAGELLKQATPFQL